MLAALNQLHPGSRAMAKYDPASIEPKWQAYWEENKTFKVEMNAEKPKFYCLDMFPYPSGAGLHVGHPEGYTATDILCRYKRMQGFNVLHPMGWDAFGLPAEQYALQTGTHPAITTQKNVITSGDKSNTNSYDGMRQHDRPRLLPLDSVDFLSAVQEGVWPIRRSPRELVPD